MKNISKSILFFAVAIAITAFYTSCSEDDDTGEPRIMYVSVTDPDLSDSLLTGAGQGIMIAIIGENLQGTREIWFNNRQASLSPTYITSTTILVQVPTLVPTVVDNKLKIVFSDGDSLLYDFEVLISEPVITGMYCEYVPEGEVATINGNYFYEPLTVTFTGGITGELVSVDDQVIQVKVPAGAQPGQIMITNNFGEVKSNFWFRDSRNIFLNSDPFTGWWGADYVVTDPGANDPTAINGNYFRVNKTISAWAWTEAAGGPPSAMGDISKNIPDEAILKPNLYNLKFEVNTMKPYNSGLIYINAGLSDDFNNSGYPWPPPYDTDGRWRTVTIPFNEIAESYGTTLSVNEDGYYTRILFFGDAELECDMSFDNFRVVPKVIGE